VDLICGDLVQEEVRKDQHQGFDQLDVVEKSPQLLILSDPDLVPRTLDQRRRQRQRKSCGKERMRTRVVIEEEGVTIEFEAEGVWAEERLEHAEGLCLVDHFRGIGGRHKPSHQTRENRLAEGSMKEELIGKRGGNERGEDCQCPFDEFGRFQLVWSVDQLLQHPNQTRKHRVVFVPVFCRIDLV